MLFPNFCSINILVMKISQLQRRRKEISVQLVLIYKEKQLHMHVTPFLEQYKLLMRYICPNINFYAN